MAELVYDKSPCKCSCHVSCFVCVLVSFCVCINDLASNQTKEKQNKAFIQFFLIFLILSSPCSCFFCLLLLFFLHHHSWDLTLPPQWESIPETPRSPRQTPSHSFTFTGGGGGKAYRGVPGQEGVQKHQQPQNTGKLLSVCSRLRTYISLIYH